MKTVSIITVNYNQYQVNIDFLNSIKLHSSNNQLEVIFVDNGSKIEYENAYREIYPDLVYIRSNKNLGFAGGNNLGIKIASGDYLLLLNNDTEITPNLIDSLVEELDRNPSIGLISPLILFYDQPSTIQYAGYTKMNYLTGRNKDIGGMETNTGQYDAENRETAYCHGAAMMCRKSTLERVGLLSEDYFLYYEELDWCEKFKRAGLKLWFLGKAKIYHKESISVGKESAIKTYFMTRNRMLFIRRNTGFLNTAFFSIYFVFIAATKQIIGFLLKGKVDLAKWTLRALAWNFTHNKNSKELGFKI
ncbi:glycosyltransferase family 2 protein [Pedobacter agri]|uniref:glycosyltransferase family 2 protein n=1 Tax=Pedobacter agri TaxID=454586 RepID=UPI00292F53E1|nr:glycosyltransferase family 2 protein [Pedobacter agri]